MKKKFGFTLAEMLIAVGIVGVIAALTIPGLMNNSRNETNAAKLSVTMATLENAFKTMLIQENATNLFETQAWRGGIVSQNNPWNQSLARFSNPELFAGNLGRYLLFNSFEVQSATAYYNNRGPYKLSTSGGIGDLENFANTQPLVIELRSGATVFIGACNSNPADEQTIINNGGALFNEAADIYIDVNGKSEPNARGRDIFGFYLGDNGILYPLGGQDVFIFDGYPTWDTVNNGCFPGDIDNSETCTARLISDGYKMNY